MINFINVGNINDDGVYTYISNEKKLGHSRIYNFYKSMDYNKNTYEILSKKANLCLNHNNCVYISDFEIYEEYRGMGYGKILLNHVLKLSSTFMIEYVFLNCKLDNVAAQNLYKQFQFDKYGKNDVDDVLIYKIPIQ
jgi:ribosomal protein S18 acetylase RimI-like enzyme